MIASSYSGMNTHQGIEYIFSDYQKLDDPTINDFISGIPFSLNQAASDVLHSFSSDKTKIRCRTILKNQINKYHEQIGTLTPAVSNSIRFVDLKDSKILIAIHQPNLFAYGGVFKKIILLQALKSHIMSKDSSQNIVSLFLIINHDFMGDFWTRVAELPSIKSSDGVLELRYGVTPHNRWKMTSNSPPPSNIILEKWEKQVARWIKNCSLSLGQEKEKFINNFTDFWKLVKYSRSHAKSYSDFNSFLMSLVANKIWNYDTLFVNLTDLAGAFEDGYKFLISNNMRLATTLKECEKTFDQFGVRKGFSSNSYLYAPIWLHCRCGSKAPSTLVIDLGKIMGSGNCMACKKSIRLNFGSPANPIIGSDVISNISPRAIPILLLLSRELNTSCYVTGTGGSLRYTLVASKVFKALDINSPVSIIWPSNDDYIGIGQNEAMQYSKYSTVRDMRSYLDDLYRRVEEERSVIIPLIKERNRLIENNLPIKALLRKIFLIKEHQREIRNLITETKKVMGAIELKPCIIDYAVNFGIKEIEVIWKSALHNTEDLFSPIPFPNHKSKN
jgi:hypothetical protein